MNGSESFLLNWFATANYELMKWMHAYWWQAWAGLFLIGSMIGMSPLQFHHEQNFRQIAFVVMRKSILYLSFLLFMLPLIALYLYDATSTNQLGQSQKAFITWFVGLTKQHWKDPVLGLLVGFIFRLSFERYINPWISNLMRKLRNEVVEDELSDIRSESEKYGAKTFDPQKHYRKDNVFVGLDADSKPIYIPLSTWLETNVQVIGPTRYGKGVVLGNVIDQAIRRLETVFYIDPKNDKFLPAIMQQACVETGRKFYYLTLHDEGIGKWAPFAGGSERDGLARAEAAFGLQLTGDPGTDFYKSQERKSFEAAFKKSRNIEGLRKLLADTEALRVNAELERWSQVETLCPKSGTGFSIEKALLENAVVYVQGSLTDNLIITATKIFILELLQEMKRLSKQRQSHVLTGVDEVSFLVFKELAQALATMVGFRSNFVLAYQSQNDLLNLQDQTLNGKYIYQSINVNSQVKMVYGGADAETALWASTLSGTVQKEVTKLEKTSVTGVGGEAWDKQRAVGATEENLIPMNTVLTLPPRVCVLIQPRKLASILYTSFVKVNDENQLNDYLEQKAKQYTLHTEKIESEPSTQQIESENDEGLYAEHFITQEVEPTPEIAKEIDQSNQVSHAKSENESDEPAKNETLNTALENNDTLSEDEAAKRAKAKARKQRQKENKRMAKEQPVPEQPPMLNDQAQTKTELIDDDHSFLTELVTPSIDNNPPKIAKTQKSDLDLMASLSDHEDDD